MSGRALWTEGRPLPGRALGDGAAAAVLPLEALNRAGEQVARLREEVRALTEEREALRARVAVLEGAELRRRRVEAITLRVVDHTRGCEVGSGLGETERRLGHLLTTNGGGR